MPMTTFLPCARAGAKGAQKRAPVATRRDTHCMVPSPSIFEPGLAARVKRLDLAAAQAGHVAFHRQAALDLTIAEMPVAQGHGIVDLGVELRHFRGVERIEP